MTAKPNHGTVKWIEPDGWHGWINGREFISFGITMVCDQVAAQIPGDVAWVYSNRATVHAERMTVNVGHTGGKCGPTCPPSCREWHPTDAEIDAAIKAVRDFDRT